MHLNTFGKSLIKLKCLIGVKKLFNQELEIFISNSNQNTYNIKNVFDYSSRGVWLINGNLLLQGEHEPKDNGKQSSLLFICNKTNSKNQVIKGDNLWIKIIYRFLKAYSQNFFRKRALHVDV